MFFKVYGEFVGKQRPRFTRDGRVYTPKKTMSYEQQIRFEYMRNFGERRILEPVYVGIIVYYEIPKSWSKKKQEQALNGEIQPMVKPDIDNITKTILDALNGLAYDDDKQVTKIDVVKRYAKEPSVAIVIEENVSIEQN